MVDSSAAIAGTKISPNFGSQNVVTTGTSTAASFIPTSSSVPTNGVYLPSANNVAISTSGTQRVNFGTDAVVFNETGENYDFRIEGDTEPNLVFVDASTNRVGLGTSSPSVNLHISSLSSPKLRIADTGTAPTSFGQTNGGLELVGGNANTSAKYMPAIKFGSTDSAFTTTTPKFSAAITAEASEAYDADTDGGMSLAFWTTPHDPGTGGNLQQRLTILNSGSVGIGTTAPSVNLHVSNAGGVPSAVNVGRFSNDGARLDITVTSAASGDALVDLSAFSAGSGNSSSSALSFSTRNAGALGERARIDSSGTFRVKGAGTAGVTDAVQLNGSAPANSLLLDASGRLLVGTSTSASSWSTTTLEIIGTTTNSANLVIGRNDASIIAGNSIGRVSFWGNASSGTTYQECARIEAEADDTHGDGDKPTRLVFLTTADGASSPTERMTIKNDGSIVLGNSTSAASATTNQISFNNLLTTDTQAQAIFANTEAADTAAIAVFNRQGSDGRLVQFRQANTTEGTISVSGTTVTYGGGHLARWSQLPNDEDPSNILKGTVMSNLDEMCEWGEEDNEQLNKTKVSDVEGDPNVAGVFVSTSFDKDGPLDFFVAMTGDMIIRIAEGVTVQRGDLLMSAGDGTAKPQDDDIIRSKTIAKVTSNHITCTYDDGSYCVPCVLMAC
jgi:hypothetical protein